MIEFYKSIILVFSLIWTTISIILVFSLIWTASLMIICMILYKQGVKYTLLQKLLVISLSTTIVIDMFLVLIAYLVG